METAQACYYEQREASQSESLKVELVSESLGMFGLPQEEGRWKTNSHVDEGKISSGLVSVQIPSTSAISSSLPTDWIFNSSLATQMEGLW